jgi:hypothetical protein
MSLFLFLGSSNENGGCLIFLKNNDSAKITDVRLDFPDPDIKQSIYIPSIAYKQKYEVTINLKNPNSELSSMHISYKDKNGQAQREKILDIVDFDIGCRVKVDISPKDIYEYKFKIHEYVFGNLFDDLRFRIDDLADKLGGYEIIKLQTNLKHTNE